jgi:branched-chain amino acid transport system ATP-binding protein
MKEHGPHKRARPLLQVRRLQKSFGGIMAVAEVSFDIGPSEIVGLVGPNGAGKTTLFNLLSGFYPPDQGSASLDGTPINGLSPHQLASMGIARTFQSLQVFEEMTALENVMVGRHLHTRSGLLAAAFRAPRAEREEQRVREEALTFLKRMGLDHRADELARNLSFGEQRRLEIARALAAEPKLLMLDEPCAGLTQVEKDTLAEIIRQIRADGVAVLLVEHDVDLVMDLVDRVLVLDYGRLIAQGSPEQVQSDPLVIEAYLGTEWDGFPVPADHRLADE